MCIVYVRNRASSISSYILKEREKERKRNKKVVVVVISLDFEAFIIANEKIMNTRVEFTTSQHFSRAPFLKLFSLLLLLMLLFWCPPPPKKTGGIFNDEFKKKPSTIETNL